MKKIILIFSLLLSFGVIATFIYSTTVDNRLFTESEREYIAEKELVDSGEGSVERFTIAESLYRDRQAVRQRITLGMLIVTVVTILFKFIVAMSESYKHYSDTKIAKVFGIIHLVFLAFGLILMFTLNLEDVPRIYLRFALPVLVALDFFLDSIGIIFTEKNTLKD